MNNSSRARLLRLTPIALSIGIMAAPVLAGSTTYTLDAQFDVGVLDGVNHTAPNNNQLQLNVTGTTFPVLWIANAGEDTLSKFDTSQNGASPGREVARYHTWFNTGANSTGNHGAWDGPAPSRTAVDINGNAYVLNRHFDGRPALLFKILADGFVDRNTNGVMDTSQDANNDGTIQGSEMLDLIDTNGNGIINDSEIKDERIAWAVRVPDGTTGFPLKPGQLGRSLCIGTDGNLWVGLYNERTYYKVSATDGHTLAGPVAVTWTPYGCLIDRDGVLWSASLSGRLGKITNTQSNSGPYTVSQFDGPSNYGIALGRAADNTTRVYLGGSSNSYTEFNSVTNTFSSPADVFYSSLGVNVDGDGNIVVSKSNGGVVKFRPADGSVVWDKPAQSGTASDSRGIMPDANNDVWQVHLGASKISKFKGTDGTALGVLNSGLSPYTYSDASGSAARTITTGTGTWTVIQDGGTAGTKWGKVSWSATVPTGGNVIAEVRTADTEAGLPLLAYTPVTNGVDFNQLGRYIQVRVRLTANTQNQSPIVQDVTVTSIGQLVCDIDGDGDVDRNDVNAIFAARGTRVQPGDPRDIDNDGLITVNDGRACVLKCTRTNCATQ